MDVDPSLRDTLIIVALALAGLSLLLVLAVLLPLALRVRRLRRDTLVLRGADPDLDRRGSFLDIVADQIRTVEDLRDHVADLRDDVDRARSAMADALRGVAVVRYDAFGDTGGRLSFSAALLDTDGDGLVLTSLHGRAETRLYVKSVRGGVGDSALSPEEQDSVASAQALMSDRPVLR